MEPRFAKDGEDQQETRRYFAEILNWYQLDLL